MLYKKQSLRIKANGDLTSLHDNTVVVPTDKTSNNAVFVIKNYYFYYYIYSNEAEFVHWLIKDDYRAKASASFLCIYLKLDSPGQLSTRLSDKRHDLKFVIITFPQLDSNIPIAPAYG